MVNLDFPAEPAFELRKMTKLETTSADSYKMLLNHCRAITLELLEPPRPYLNRPALHDSKECLIDELSCDDMAFLCDLFEINKFELYKIADSEDNFKRHLSILSGAANAPKWDLIRILKTDTDHHCQMRQEKYEALLNGGLVACVNNGDVIKLDEDAYKLPKRFSINELEISNPDTQRVCIPVIWYTLIGDDLSEYLDKINNGKCGELRKIKCKNDINQVINDSLLRGELPVHRFDTGVIVDYVGYPSSIDNVIYWSEARLILNKRTGQNYPEIPVFMKDWPEIEQGISDDLAKEGLDKYLNHFQIAKLWAANENRQSDAKQYERSISQAILNSDLLAEISIRNPSALGGFEVIPYSPTILSQARNGWLNGTYLYFTVHRDNFRAWLEKSKQWPLPDGCLLAKWFDSEPQTEAIPPASPTKEQPEMADDGKPQKWLDFPESIPSISKAPLQTEPAPALPTIDELYTEPKNTRKMRIHIQRDTTESLILIDDILTHYNISFLDELPAVQAWANVVSHDYPDKKGLIKEVAENKKSIILFTEGKFEKKDFLEKYRKRFKVAK